MTTNEMNRKIREIGKIRGLDSVMNSIRFVAEELVMGKGRPVNEITVMEMAEMLIYMTEFLGALDMDDSCFMNEVRRLAIQAISRQESKEES